MYKNKQGKRVTIPFHGSKILHPKVLKSILVDADISPEELVKLL
ncbi:MAG: type II toxin-antitoxin system HicA family toxin [Candidatus Colwellbacteria bacterium]